MKNESNSSILINLIAAPLYIAKYAVNNPIKTLVLTLSLLEIPKAQATSINKDLLKEVDAGINNILGSNTRNERIWGSTFFAACTYTTGNPAAGLFCGHMGSKLGATAHETEKDLIKAGKKLGDAASKTWKRWRGH